MDAIQLLTSDHDTVRDLLEKLTETTERASKKRKELLERIEKELKVHTTIEEEIFYPAFRDAGGKERAVMVAEAREEHRAVDELVLPDLLHTDVESVQFSGRAKVLKELIEHHAEEEEEEMFPDARKALGKAELEKLGEQMMARKEELEGKL
jgi:hemerythrin-like domain-containing protein